MLTLRDLDSENLLDMHVQIISIKTYRKNVTAKKCLTTTHMHIIYGIEKCNRLLMRYK